MLADREAKLKELQSLLEGEQSKNRIQSLEIEKLVEVCARDRARVEAEKSSWIRQIAEAEGK